MLKGVDGYVVAVEIKPWTNVSPENITVVSTSAINTMAQINIEDYRIRTIQTVPELTVYDASSNLPGIVCGFNSDVVYEYSKLNDDGTYGIWCSMETGNSVFKFAAGKYRVRVMETIEHPQSDYVQIEVGLTDVALLDIGTFAARRRSKSSTV